MHPDAIDLRSARDDRFVRSLSVSVSGGYGGEKKRTEDGQTQKKDSKGVS